MTDQITNKLKKQVAEHAVSFVESNMVVGLGEGSTAILALYKIGDLVKSGKLKNIIGIPCSKNIEKAALDTGITVSTLDIHNSIDLTIDGADEIDADLNLIKGGGGALLREKMVAQASKREIIVVDESKISKYLGEKWVLPIEVVQFGWQSHFGFLNNLGGEPKRRLKPDGKEFVTDQGNYILDVNFGIIKNPAKLNIQLYNRSGIVDHGLFINLTTDVLISRPDGIEHIQK